jgi:tartrate-resistant acid phosphatase type 5
MKRLLLCALLATGCGTSLVVQPFREVACATATPPVAIEGPAGPSLRLLAVGDTGEGPDERGSHLATTIAAMRKVEGADAMLLLGDNIYRCGAKSTSDPEWQRVIAPLFAVGVPIYPVLGNHDWGRREQVGCTFSNPAAQIQKTGTAGFELWRFPAPTYIVQTEIAELVMFDSSPIAENWPDEIGKALCPLRAALAAPKTKPWRIVVAHHPLYSCGEHGNDRATQNMRDALQTLLVESKVDLYVAGHDHDLELATAPVASPVFLVSGSGSKIRRRGARCAEGENFRIVGGFAVLDMTANDLTIRVHCNGTEAPCMERRLTPTR